MPPIWVRAAISVVVAGILLTFVPIGEVWSAITAVSPWIWAASVVIFTAGHATNAMKLRLLLGPGASAAACLRAQFAGIAANLGLPGVMGGDVVRAAYLVPRIGAARVAAGAVMDRIVDFTILGAIVLVASHQAGSPAAARRGGGETDPTIWIVVAAVICLLAVLGRRRLRRAGAWPRVREAFGAIVQRPWTIVLALGISLGVQTTFVLTNVWLASQMGVRMPLAPWFLAWTASKLGAILPISVGGIGVREATLVSVLAAYGAPADAVLATGLLWEGALVVGSLGGFVLTQISERR